MSHNAKVFDTHADRYDAWYDSPAGQIILSMELACLRPFLEALPRPYVEIGIGTGRFAQALGIEFGVDPAFKAVNMAYERGMQASIGVAERLPFRTASFGGALMALTLCFVENASQTLQEVRRVLAPRGGLVLGLILRGTPWADYYAQKGAEGHPMYRIAHFYSPEEVEGLLKGTHFAVTGYRSTLFQKPGLETYLREQPVEGYVPGSGFVAIAAGKTEKEAE